MLEPGHTLGRYRVEDKLGAGGMGEVYRAWDSVLRRWVALKVVAKGDGSGRAERLVGEARAAAALRHANIVSVYDVGEDAGYAFVSMDLVEGRTLRDYVGDTSIPFDKQLAWLLQIGNALRAAHKAGFVHRDIKPDNVMITIEGDVRVLDFGLAKSFSVDVTAPTAHEAGSGPEAFKTAEGRVSGTPAYMAPEQLAGAPASPSWDQYAFGVMACELFTGKHPRLAGLVSVSGWVKPESMQHAPPSIAQVVARAMAPSPDQRFPSMDAVVAALGGPVSGGAPYVVAGTNPPPNTASMPSATMNVQIGDTLQVPVHPNAPKPQKRGRGLGLIATGAVVLAASAVVVWRLRATTAASVASPPAASSAPVVLASAPPAPVASVSVVTVASAPPIASATGTNVAIPAAPPKPRKLSVSMSAIPTFQYDAHRIESMVAGVRPLVKMCMEQHPPRTLPARLGVDLELWNIGGESGKVRDVRVTEPPALAKCLYEAFSPLSMGPPKSSTMPPGSVFVDIDVANEP